LALNPTSGRIVLIPTIQKERTPGETTTVQKNKKNKTITFVDYIDNCQ